MFLTRLKIPRCFRFHFIRMNRRQHDVELKESSSAIVMIGPQAIASRAIRPGGEAESKKQKLSPMTQYDPGGAFSPSHPSSGRLCALSPCQQVSARNVH